MDMEVDAGDIHLSKIARSSALSIVFSHGVDEKPRCVTLEARLFSGGSHELLRIFEWGDVMKEPLKDFMLADGPLFRPSFYTTAMAYDRRERDPFPPVNVYYWGNLILAQALLPGLELSDVGVRLEMGRLIIEGAVPRRKGLYYHTERYTGPFCRKIELGAEVEPRFRVSMQEGIMHVILKRRKDA